MSLDLTKDEVIALSELISRAHDLGIPVMLPKSKLPYLVTCLQKLIAYYDNFEK